MYVLASLRPNLVGMVGPCMTEIATLAARTHRSASEMSGELSVPTREIQRKSRGSAFSARVRLKDPAGIVH